MGFFDFFSGLFSSKKKAVPKKKAAKRSKGRKKTAGKAAAIDADQLARDLQTVRDEPEKRKKKKRKKKAGSKLKTAATQKKKKKKISTDVGSILKFKKSKEKKKAKKVKAKPIDEDALGFSVKLDSEDEDAKQRKAFRITVKGLKVRCDRLGGLLQAEDLSASGLGFKFKKPRIKGGVVLKLDIIHQNEVKAENVDCKVMRHEKGVVGCMFMDMDRHQEDAVHELVVIGQKEQADRRRKQKDKNWAPPG